MFADGSYATGSIRFSVGTGTPPPPNDRAAPPTAGEAGSAAGAGGGHEHGEVDPLGATLLVVDALFVMGAMLWLIAKPRTGQAMTRDAARYGPAQR